ncbi:MAG: RHS repeat-associated core domain-containing protein, partial [Bacteroidota bacterium]|nr:RHS repeat-associated core domain-containing protein [Bacteroidota bacterium]
PFGLSFNSYQRVTATLNRYKFNGVEHVQDWGLSMYQTLFRLYDPTIGRFHQVDPLAELMPGINPYNFGFDNPISFADPDGLAPIWWITLKAQMNKIGKRLNGDKTSPGVASGMHKGTRLTVTTVNHHIGRTYGTVKPTPDPSNSVAQNIPEKVQPIGIDFVKDKPNINVTINSVKVPAPEEPTLRLNGQDPIPIRTGSNVRMNFSPFGGNSSMVNNTGQLNNFLNPIADFLNDNPTMAITIVINTQITQNQLNQIININGGSNNATTTQLLTARGQAVQRALLSLGTDPRQVVFMFNNGANTNRIDLRFRNR